MLNVSDALKQIYRRNMQPLSTVKSDIQGKIAFGDLGVTVGNDRIVKDTFRLTEMISDGGDLDFGSTNASVVEFTVADVPEDLSGQRFTITQTVNGTYTVPLGTFTVDSCKRQDDLRFKDIVAYDDMQKFNRNVAEWYNGLTFPLTVKAMIESLCQYCGVAYESVTLVNDNVRVYKTLDTNELNGKEVLRAIAEVNGTFAHINRYAKLTFIGLDSFALYPSETLYPADDLYPIDVTEIVEKQGENAIAYISSKYEDYTVSAIDGVIVRDDENADGGITVGETTNPYVMSGNMLIVGKTTEELTTIANNLLSKIGKVVYTPHDTESIGLPYVEVGDTVLNANSADKELFIAKRVLTGVSSVMDNFSATGNPKRENNDTVDSVEIRKLKGKTMKITKDIDRIGVEIENFETSTNTRFEVSDGRITAEISRAQSAEASLQLSINGLSSTVSNLATDTSTRFTQTNAAITAEAKRAAEAEASLQISINGVSSSVSNLENYTESQIQQLSSSISFKVSKGSIISEINQSAESVTIDASKINLTGYVTITDLETEGTTEINGANILTGTLTANAISTDFFTTASKYAGWTIQGHPTASDAAYICGNNSKENNVVLKTGGDVAFACGLEGYYPGNPTTGATIQIYHNGNIQCQRINWGIPITDLDIEDYIISNTNQITPTLTSSGNIDFAGSVNAASVTYVQNNFARQSALEALEARVSALEK